MTTYIYPQNLKSSANLWFWKLKDFSIICISLLISILIFAQSKSPIFLAIVIAYAILTIRFDETAVIDFIKYSSKYFISSQQKFIWKERD